MQPFFVLYTHDQRKRFHRHRWVDEREAGVIRQKQTSADMVDQSRVCPAGVNAFQSRDRRLKRFYHEIGQPALRIKGGDVAVRAQLNRQRSPVQIV